MDNQIYNMDEMTIRYLNIMFKENDIHTIHGIFDIVGNPDIIEEKLINIITTLDDRDRSITQVTALLYNEVNNYLTSLGILVTIHEITLKELYYLLYSLKYVIRPDLVVDRSIVDILNSDDDDAMKLAKVCEYLTIADMAGMYNVIHEVSDSITGTLSRVLEQNLLIQDMDVSDVPDTITLPDRLLRTYSFKLYKDNSYSKYAFSKYSNLLYGRVMELHNTNEIELVANEIYVYILNCDEVDSINEMLPYYYDNIEQDLVELGMRGEVITKITEYYTKLIGDKYD